MNCMAAYSPMFLSSGKRARGRKHWPARPRPGSPADGDETINAIGGRIWKGGLQKDGVLAAGRQPPGFACTYQSGRANVSSVRACRFRREIVLCCHRIGFGASLELAC